MGYIGHRDTGGNGVQEVWATWAVRPMGNVDTGGNEAHWEYGVQGYGVHGQ